MGSAYHDLYLFHIDRKTSASNAQRDIIEEF